MTKRGLKCLLNALLLAFLILVCILPGRWLAQVCEDLTRETEQAAAAVLSGEDVSPHLNAIQAIYQDSAPHLRLFMDHSAIDALETAIAVCIPLNEQAALLSGLNAIKAAAGHLMDMESLGWESLL